MARSAMNVLVAAAILGFLGCGGGSGNGSGGTVYHPPALRTLAFSPNPATVDASTGAVDVMGSVEFTDTGGDLATLFLDSPLGRITTPIQGAQGAVSGTVQGTVRLAPQTFGPVAFEVWVTDQAGSASNHLSGTITFLRDDTATVWTRVSLQPAQAVAFAPESTQARYVAVGSAGLILASPDGITWNPQVSGVTADLTGVAWSGSRFVAVGDGPTLVSSGDGLHWTPQVLPVTTGRLNAVAWGGGAFLAVGRSADTGPGTLSGSLVLRSADGISWIPGSGCSDASGTLYDAAWNGQRWVAVADSRWTSPDGGATWSPATGDVGGQATFAVGWNGAMLVAVGAAGGVLRSPDGLAWTLNADRLGGVNYWGLCWSGHRWLALDLSGWHGTSTDGLSWVSSGGSPFQAPAKVIWDGTRYVAAGGGIWTSP